MRAASVSANGRALWRIGGLAALVACVCGWLGVSAAPAVASTYTMTDIGSLGNGGTVAYGINNSGQITGRSIVAKRFKVQCFDPSLKPPCFVTPPHPFLWTAGTMIDLGTLGGTEGAGQAINNSGEMAGWSYTSDNNNIHAFLDQNGHLTDLGDAFISPGESFAYAINESGVVAGEASALDGSDAFTDAAGKMQDLGRLPGGTSATARGINNAGEVVGEGDSAESEGRAWLYANGKMTDLGTLGGPVAGATAINNSGQIVGFAQTSTDANHGFIYQNGKMTDLGLDVFPEAINDSGVIVGQALGGAFVESSGKIENLNNLVPARSGFTLENATGINKSGQIVANANGHAFLLTPGKG